MSKDIHQALRLDSGPVSARHHGLDRGLAMNNHKDIAVCFDFLRKPGDDSWRNVGYLATRDNDHPVFTGKLAQTQHGFDDESVVFETDVIRDCHRTDTSDGRPPDKFRREHCAIGHRGVRMEFVAFHRWIVLDSRARANGRSHKGKGRLSPALECCRRPMPQRASRERIIARTVSEVSTAMYGETA